MNRPNHCCLSQLTKSNSARSFDTVVECQKGYIKKCATPLQKELFDFFLESFTKTVEEFCANPENKQSKCGRHCARSTCLPGFNQ